MNPQAQDSGHINRQGVHWVGVTLEDNIWYIFVRNDITYGCGLFVDCLRKGDVAALVGPKSGTSRVDANSPHPASSAFKHLAQLSKERPMWPLQQQKLWSILSAK
jgi:hypothetical protein